MLRKMIVGLFKDVKSAYGPREMCFLTAFSTAFTSEKNHYQLKLKKFRVFHPSSTRRKRMISFLSRSCSCFFLCHFLFCTNTFYVCAAYKTHLSGTLLPCLQPVRILEAVPCRASYCCCKSFSMTFACSKRTLLSLPCYPYTAFVALFFNTTATVL